MNHTMYLQKRLIAINRYGQGTGKGYKTEWLECLKIKLSND